MITATDWHISHSVSRSPRPLSDIRRTATTTSSILIMGSSSYAIPRPDEKLKVYGLNTKLFV